MAVKQEESFELVHEIFQLKTSGQIASLPAAQGNYTAYNIHVLSSLQYSQAYATYMYCTLLYRVQKVKSTVHKIHVPQYHILVLSCTSRETFCVRT